MMPDKQEQWLIELEKENNERLVQLEQAMLDKEKLHLIKTEKLKIKAAATEQFNVKHPRLSFLKRYNVIIIMLLGLLITVVFNISMFME